jgi:hypothetical protein
MIEKIGEFSPEVIVALNLEIAEGTAIYIGATNIAHMVTEHEYEYYRFFDKIPEIISSPDYVRLKADDKSIELVKHYGKYIKLAVRIAGDGEYYARSLYSIRERIVKKLISDGELKTVDKTPKE